MIKKKLGKTPTNSKHEIISNFCIGKFMKMNI